MSEAKDAHWSDNEIEALFTTLGKYWVIYQWIEGQLDKLMLLAWGHENWTASQTKFGGMTNKQKIDSLESIVLTMPDSARAYARPDCSRGRDASYPAPPVTGGGYPPPVG
jgi:hypothetical protein